MIKKLIPLLLISNIANASLELGDFSLSGYGTVAYTYSDVDWGYYRSKAEQDWDSGVGKETPGSTSPDSTFALQADYVFDENFSAAAQTVSRSKSDGEYNPFFEWAFIKYTDDEFDVKVGRYVPQIFNNSSIRNVGFGQIWVRPPTNVYVLNALTYIDGYDAGYTINTGGDTTIRIGYGAGKATQDLIFDALHADSVDYDTHNFNITAEIGNHTFRVESYRAVLTFYGRAKEYDEGLGYLLNLALAGVPSAWIIVQGAAKSQGAAVDVNSTSSQSKAATFNIAYSYHGDNFVADIEHISRYSKSVDIYDAVGQYIMLGMPINKFKLTPFVMYSEVLQPENPDNFRIKMEEVPEQLKEQANKLNQFLDTTLGDFSSKTATVGVRYDGIENLAVKFQMDRIYKAEGSSANVFVKGDYPLSSYKQTVDVYAVAVDFIF